MISFVNEEAGVYTYPDLSYFHLYLGGWFGQQAKKMFPLYIRGVSVDMEGEVHGI